MENNRNIVNIANSGSVMFNGHELKDMPVNYSALHFPEFHGLEEWMLLRALQALQTEGKAEIITMDDGKGVKFF